MEGNKEVLGKAYRCRTCITKYGLNPEYLMCEGCKGACHKGHKVETAGMHTFVCNCQLEMRECKLAVDCTLQYTGRKFVHQTMYRCETDCMKPGQFVCTFCANNCHKGHTVELKSSGTGFCDCPDMFPNCLHRKRK